MSNQNNKKESFKNLNLIFGDCVQEMAKLEEESIDAIVTDPPYGLKFMGKEFDDLGEGAKQREWHKAWAVETLRVLKPGGHLLAFGGTRTYHHLATAVEEVGFEVRDQMQWLYGSGFPKSLNVGKAIDKRGGYPQLAKEIGAAIKKAREKRGLTVRACDKKYCGGTTNWSWYEGRPKGQRAPDSETFSVIANDWPELKPLSEKVKEAEREVVGKKKSGIANKEEGPRHTIGASKAIELDITAPATEEAARWEGWGTALKPANEPIVVARKPFNNNQKTKETLQTITRFIYAPKAGKTERNAGIENGNKHPTVKPIKAMSYLIKSVSKEKDLILDPFVGSGSTGLSAIETNRRFIGIEKDPEYMEIAKARLNYKLNKEDGQK